MLNFFSKFKFVLKPTGILIVLATTISFLYLVLNTSYFEINEIRFEGADQIEKDRLLPIAEKYKGKNIYSINLDQLENDVRDLSVYIRYVYARKELPDRIIIEIKERYPKFVVTNLNNVYLIDKDYLVTNIPFEDEVNYTQDEWDIFNGITTDNELIKSRIISNLTQIDPNFNEEEFDYANYDPNEKQTEVNEIKQEMQGQIQGHFENLDKQINESEFASLPRLNIYENGKYSEGDKPYATQMEVSSQVLEYFAASQNYSITTMTWDSLFSLEVQTIEKKIFLFGTNRPIGAQIDDLQIVLNEITLSSKKFSRIDLRSEVIAVK